jgi:anti-sigma factor RsiW
MNPPPDDQMLARWLDNELGAEERTRFEAMLAADPALRQEAESMKGLGNALRAHVPFEREVPHPDFFNSQIQEAIAADQRVHARSKGGVRAAAGWLVWLRAPWALAGAAAVLAGGLFLLRSGDAAKVRTEILSLYAPNAGVQAAVSYNEDAEATVLLLDGLEAIPADRNVAGISVHHSETDAEVATTTLFDEAGGVLLVMAKDAAGKPRTMGRNF